MIINHANYAAVHGPNIPRSVGEVNTLPSQTIPDQTLPLKTLLERYVRGGDVAVFPGVYSEDVPPGLEDLTEIERIDASRELKAALIRHQIGRSLSKIEPEPTKTSDDSKIEPEPTKTSDDESQSD